MSGSLASHAIRLPADAADSWQRDRCVVVPRCVPPALAAVWEVAARECWDRTTHYEDPAGGTWREQFFADLDVPCSGLARDGALLRQVAAATGVAGFDPARTLAWINRYGPGDQVPEHVDRAGDCQFLVCLQAPPPDGGGVLHVDGRPVPLARGDALLWAAHTQRHHMTAITAPATRPSSAARVTFVMRLFAAAHA